MVEKKVENALRIANADLVLISQWLSKQETMGKKEIQTAIENIIRVSNKLDEILAWG